MPYKSLALYGEYDSLEIVCGIELAKYFHNSKNQINFTSSAASS
jgi:hypothetical protein